MKRRTLIRLICALFVFGALLLLFARASGAEPVAPIRIGVYDNRAIAVAFAPSKYNDIGALMTEYRQAKEAGDQQKMHELEQRGKDHQRLLHFQGFCHVPVGELLEPVRDGIADIAAKRNLVAVARACDFHGDNVELVDITDDLVALYEPSERTLRFVAQIRDAEAQPLIVIADMKAED